MCVCLSIYKLPTRRVGAAIYTYRTHAQTQTHNSRIQGSPKNPLTNVKPIILADAGRSVALGKRGTDTRATMMGSRRKGRGRRTQQRGGRSRGAEAAEKGERLFCPAVKTCKSSPTTRRTKKKEEAGGKGTASKDDGGGRAEAEKRGKGTRKLFASAPRHTKPRRVPCQATPRLDRPPTADRRRGVKPTRRAQAELPRPRRALGVRVCVCVSRGTARHGAATRSRACRRQRWRTACEVMERIHNGRWRDITRAPRRETRLISAAIFPSSFHSMYRVIRARQGMESNVTQMRVISLLSRGLATGAFYIIIPAEKFPINVRLNCAYLRS